MSEAISEREFQTASEQHIASLERAFGELAELWDIDVQVEGGVLSITFEEGEPGKFILSPNSSVRQLWVSARMASYKFDYDGTLGDFVLTGQPETLKQVMTRLTKEQLGSEVTL